MGRPTSGESARGTARSLCQAAQAEAGSLPSWAPTWASPYLGDYTLANPGWEEGTSERALSTGGEALADHTSLLGRRETGREGGSALKIPWVGSGACVVFYGVCLLPPMMNIWCTAGFVTGKG